MRARKIGDHPSNPIFGAYEGNPSSKSTFNVFSNFKHGSVRIAAGVKHEVLLRM